jgi:hypothetical protein
MQKALEVSGPKRFVKFVSFIRLWQGEEGMNFLPPCLQYPIKANWRLIYDASKQDGDRSGCDRLTITMRFGIWPRKPDPASRSRSIQWSANPTPGRGNPSPQMAPEC